MPVKTLKKVVLPAPLGPMIEAMWPSSSSKSSESSAVSPPNRFVTPLASRMTVMSVLGTHRRVAQLAVPALGRQDALGAEDHHQDEDEAEDHTLVLGRLELRRQVGEAPAEDGHPSVPELVEPEGQPLQHLQ